MLAVGMIAGFSSGIIAVLISYFLGISEAVEQNEIKPVETLTWSLKEAIEQVSHIIIPLLTVAIAIVIMGLVAQQLQVGLLAGIVGISFISAVVGIIGGLRGTEVEEKNRPNQGIWQSFRYGILGTLIGFIFAIITGLPGAFILGWQTSLIISIFVGTIAGLGYGFVYGGSAFLKHVVLRILLMKSGNIPFNYARFLDYATNLVLLRKVGGGYIFIHRMLLEYFAGLYNSSETKMKP